MLYGSLATSKKRRWYVYWVSWRPLSAAFVHPRISPPRRLCMPWLYRFIQSISVLGLSELVGLALLPWWGTVQIKNRRCLGKVLLVHTFYSFYPPKPIVLLGSFVWMIVKGRYIAVVSLEGQYGVFNKGDRKKWTMMRSDWFQFSITLRCTLAWR